MEHRRRVRVYRLVNEHIVRQRLERIAFLLVGCKIFDAGQLVFRLPMLLHQRSERALKLKRQLLRDREAFRQRRDLRRLRIESLLRAAPVSGKMGD